VRFPRQLVQHPLWLDSKLWDGPKLRDAVLAKTAARAWTMDDWAETIHLWTKFNLVLWQLLFVERSTKSLGGAEFTPASSR